MKLSRSLSNSENHSDPVQVALIDDKIERFLDKKFRISRSFATKSTYRTALKSVQKFLKLKMNLDILQLLARVQNGTLDPVDVLDEYYTYLSQAQRKDGKIGYSAQVIKGYLITFKEFLNNQGCKIYSEELRQRIRLPKKQDVYEEGLNREIISRLIRLANYKLATIILIAVSSGMRIGEILQLRLSDIDLTKNPTRISIRAKTTKTRQARITHISSEATKALKDYLSKCKPQKENDDYLFLIQQKETIERIKKRLQQNNYQYDVQRGLDAKRLDSLQKQLEDLDEEHLLEKSLNMTKHNFEGQLERLVQSVPDLHKKTENGRFQIHFHAFRAWFKTQVTDAHQSDFAEALMGHKSLKLVYYRQNEKARAETFLGIEHALTISDTESIDQNYSGLQKDNLELRGIVDSLSRQLQNLENKIGQNLSR